MSTAAFIILAAIALYSATRSVLIRRARRTVFRSAAGSRRVVAPKLHEPEAIGEWLTWPGDQSGSRN